MANAKRSLGTTISINGTQIGELTEIMAPEKVAEEIEVTTLDSDGGYREFIQGFKDSGTIDISGYFFTGDAGQEELDSVYESGDFADFVITYPAEVGATHTFSGFISLLKQGDATIDDPLTFESTIRISGAVVTGTTPSTGASAITFTNGSDVALTGEVYTPTFANGTYYYSVSFNTDTDYKINVTATDHTINLYKDGSFVEELTSATSSTAITIGASEVHELDVVMYETSKTPITYNYSITRTA